MTLEPIPVLVAVLGALVALFILSRAPETPAGVLDRSARERIDERLAQLTASWTNLDTTDERPQPRPIGPDPRFRLWRDTSAVLVILGVGALGMALLTGRSASGGVLEAVATPGQGTSIASSREPSNEASPGTPGPSDAADAPAIGSPSTPVPAVRTSPDVPDRTPSPERLAALVACPAEPDCYLYEVRSGDNLSSIASWFGVSLAELLARNPDITDPGLVRAGEVIRMPTPRR